MRCWISPLVLAVMAALPAAAQLPGNPLPAVANALADGATPSCERLPDSVRLERRGRRPARLCVQQGPRRTAHLIEDGRGRAVWLATAGQGRAASFSATAAARDSLVVRLRLILGEGVPCGDGWLWRRRDGYVRIDLSPSGDVIRRDLQTRWTLGVIGEEGREAGPCRAFADGASPAAAVPPPDHPNRR
jgi:hypothetical protein